MEWRGVASASHEGIMTNRLRLLLVEDDDDVALMIHKALERAGHDVNRCRTAADALHQLAQQTYDLALLDHYLPDMAGLDMLQAIARERIATPTLMVTAYGDEQLATKVLHAGALDYVVKDPALGFLGELPKRVAESVSRHRLQQFNRLLVEALESARDGIMITDRAGTILHVNRALEGMTGYTRQELLGQTPRILKSGLHPPELYARLWQALLSRSSWQDELTNRRKDGTLIEVSLTVSTILDARGEPTHFLGIQRDITERKKFERQLVQAQKMQSIGTLAGGVAHEFNNLLAGITGYAGLGLEETLEASPLREYLEQVVGLAERAATLTRQLLAFARQPPLRQTTLALEELVRSTADFVTRTLRIEVKLELQSGTNGTPLLVEADAGQLQQALVNLALNAKDAQESPARMTFRLRPESLSATRAAFPESVPAGEYVVLEVADAGSGMAPEVLSQALDPFFTTKEVGRGTGLGLPVVLGIVHGHSGYLTIDSAPGKGTCVDLYLPSTRPS